MIYLTLIILIVFPIWLLRKLFKQPSASLLIEPQLEIFTQSLIKKYSDQIIRDDFFEDLHCNITFIPLIKLAFVTTTEGTYPTILKRFGKSLYSFEVCKLKNEFKLVFHVIYDQVPKKNQDNVGPLIVGRLIEYKPQKPEHLKMEYMKPNRVVDLFEFPQNLLLYSYKFHGDLDIGGLPRKKKFKKYIQKVEKQFGLKPMLNEVGLFDHKWTTKYDEMGVPYDKKLISYWGEYFNFDIVDPTI